VDPARRAEHQRGAALRPLWLHSREWPGGARRRRRGAARERGREGILPRHRRRGPPLVPRRQALPPAQALALGFPRTPALLLMLAVLTTASGCADQHLKPESRANLGRIDAIVEVNQASWIHGKPPSGYAPPAVAPKTFTEAISKAGRDASATAYRKGA